MLRSSGSATGVSSSDRTLDGTLAANRPDVGQQSPVEYREVPERRNCDRTCPVAGDQTLASVRSTHYRSTVGTTGHVRLGRFCVWSVADLWKFDPNGYFLSGAYKYTPNRPFE